MNALLGLIAGAILGFAGSYFAQWPTPPRVLWRAYRLRHRRQRPCFTLPSGQVFLIPSASSDDKSRYLSEHDMECLEAVAAMLRDSGYRDGYGFRLFWQDPHHDNVPAQIRAQNLVLACGPKRNRLTDTVLTRFPILRNIALILDPAPAFNWKGVIYTPTDTLDYAIVVVRKNPYNPKRRLVLLFGLKAVGTQGAGLWYAHPDYAAARIAAARDLEHASEEIEVLLSVHHTPDGQHVTAIEVVQ